MGCDIHCYMEYRRQGDSDWSPFGRRINPGRNYEAFGRLAGVRRRHETFIAPRGIPDDVAYHARNDNRCYISDSDDSDGCCTAESAARWVKGGSSKYIADHSGKDTWVTHPDWHSHSWLTPDEWEAAISGLEWTHEYKAMLAAVRSLESQGFAARIVFWFDN